MFEWILVLAILGVGAAGVVAVARGRWRRAGAAGGVCVGLFLLGLIFFREDLALQKVLSWLIMPTGLLWLGQGALALSLWARQQRGLAILATALFLVTSILGNTWLSPRLMARLEDQVEARHYEDTPHLEAILVLGGGAWLDQYQRPMVADSGDRVVLAARLWHAQKVDILVSSGSAIEAFGGELHLGEVTRTLWSQLGVSDEAILIQKGGKNTSQEIQNFAALAKTKGWTRVGVLSSAWHLPRIMALCEKNQLNVVPIGADRRGGQMPAHPALFIPRPEPWRWTQAFFWEVLGRWVGR